MDEKPCTCCDCCNCGCKGHTACALWALVASGVFFMIAGLVNLYRYLFPFAIIIHTTVIPETYSLGMFIFAAFMSIWCLWAAWRLCQCCCKTCSCHRDP